MRGAHRIIVETKKMKYDFTVYRNLTIITGDSGSGKTVLIDLIREYRRYGVDSGVSVSCDCPCRTLDTEDWEEQLKKIRGSIIFIDEGNRFLITQYFAELVQGSDNYFVIATREKLPMLPYSVKEIYGFRKSGKYLYAKQTYNEMFRLYGEFPKTGHINPRLVITEDANSGHQFFELLAGQKGIPCISANGKSNIMTTILTNVHLDDEILVIVDGAAFGSDMREVHEYQEVNTQVVLYAPESFEWLLLASDSIPDVHVAGILQAPEKVIESSQYVSWERYFTQLLIEKTNKNPIWSYSKKKLPPAYFSPRVIKAVKNVMESIDWDKEE